MIEGVDYSTARPSPAGLWAAGKRFVVRYGGAGTADKWLTRGEADRLIAAGLSIVANVEGTSGGLLGGHTTGYTWARNAASYFKTVGMPDGRPVYLSADWDVQASQLATVADALRGAADAIGVDRVGIYGGRRVIEYAQETGLARWFWQTYGWSGSPTVWVPGTHLQQYRNGVTVAGGDCDLDRAMTVDFGQWGAGTMAGNLGYSDVDGQFLCERVSALLHLAPASMGPENGQHFPAVELLKRLDAQTAAPRPVTLTEGDLAQLRDLLAPVIESTLVDILGRIGLTVRPRE